MDKSHVFLDKSIHLEVDTMMSAKFLTAMPCHNGVKAKPPGTIDVFTLRL